MTSKRIFGFVFIPIAILLTLAIIGQLPTLILVVISFFSIFTGKLNSFQVGEAFPVQAVHQLQQVFPQTVEVQEGPESIGRSCKTVRYTDAPGGKAG